MSNTFFNRMRWRLKQVGVELVDDYRFLLRCMQCGQEWSPILKEKGRRSRGFWKCPTNKCNEHLKLP
jgi:hypothetical protein